MICINAAELVLAQAQANNTWSAEQAQKQMDFQERLSNTAHQRQIADLKAAGLNPVLSAKLGGASTPSGAMGDTDQSVTSALMQALESMASGVAAGAAYGYSSGSAKRNATADNSALWDALHAGADALPYRWRKSAHAAINWIHNYAQDYLGDAVAAESSKSSAKETAKASKDGGVLQRVKSWFSKLPKASSESDLVKGTSNKQSKPLVTRTAGR